MTNILKHIRCFGTVVETVKDNMTFLMLVHLLDNKVKPTVDNVYQICANYRYENINIKAYVIDIFVKYGLLITDEVNEVLICHKIFLSNKENDRAKSFYIDKNSYEYYSNRKKFCAPLSSELKNNTENGSMEILEKMFQYSSLYKIKRYIALFNITPNLCCFENALLNNDMRVSMYVLETFDYKPNIMAIIRIGEYPRRMLLLKKLYPEISKIDYPKDDKSDETYHNTKKITLQHKLPDPSNVRYDYENVRFTDPYYDIMVDRKEKFDDYFIVSENKIEKENDDSDGDNKPKKIVKDKTKVVKKK